MSTNPKGYADINIAPYKPAPQGAAMPIEPLK